MGKAKKEKKRDKQYDLQKMLLKLATNTTDITVSEFDERNSQIYGANVNLRRNMLNIKDSLKPVYRRMLMALFILKLTPDRNYGKCSQIASKVTELYHPHSNDSVYGTLVGLGQQWRNNVQFVEYDGNFGTAYDSSAYAAINWSPYTVMYMTNMVNLQM